MSKLITKIVSLTLILSLFFGRGVIVALPAIAQSEPAATSAPVPTSPPADIKPPQAAPTSLPQPTSAPAPTSPPVTISQIIPTVQYIPTWAPQPTGSTGGSSVSSPSPTGVSTSSSDGASTAGDASSEASGEGDGQSTDDGSLAISSNDTSSSSVNDPANIATGAFSTNYASEKNENWEEVLNENLAQLQNKIDAISSSGFNYADLNTLDGQVFTGDSLATLNLLNKLNSNMTGIGGFSVFNIYDTYVGDIVFKMADGNVAGSFNSATATVSKNSVTGPGSTNEALADSSFTVREANGNDAQLVNDINLQAVSGGNSASFNTGGGTVKTGNASALANIINLVNTNLNVSKWLFGVVNVFGTLAGNIILPKDTADNSGTASSSVLAENNNTGPLSSNNASYTNSNSSNITNNNTADIASNIDISANSGNNNASVNTGGGSVTTGSSDVGLSNSTVANTNTINEEGTVWMVIVNKMGKWVGEIIGAPWGSMTASNSLPIAQTVSQNNYTGPLSTNNSTYNNTSNTTVDNNNSGAIVNNVTVDADTGNNQAQYNTGTAKIETGNAKAGLNLVNMVNTNVIAKKFVAVMVNVLGTFLGDVVSPEQQAKQVVYNVPTPTTQPTVYPATQLGGSSQPTPTNSPLPSFNTVADNIGGVVVIQQAGSDNSGSSQTDSQVESDLYYPAEYYQAVSNVSYMKTKLTSSSQEMNNYVENQAKVLKRGIFLSPTFAKATETSFAGMLLGGATLKIDQSWLSIIPIAFLIVLLRRRRKFDFSKYLNALLEIIL